MKQYILLASLFATVLPALNAQTLSEEVVIDREITPVVRKAVRPSLVTPTILTPRLTSKPLAFSEYMETAEITRGISPLAPAHWADSVMRSPYRGYASLGYFPVFNLGAAAGYRFVDTPKINAGAHLSYDGGSWSSGNDRAEGTYSRNRFEIGADAAFRFRPGVLKADIGYVFSATDIPFVPGYYDRGAQAINTVDLSLKWASVRTARFFCDAQASFGYGGFTKNMTEALPHFNNHLSEPFDFTPAKDINFGVKATPGYRFTEKSAIALDVDLRFRHTPGFNTIRPQIFHSDVPSEEYATVVPESHGPQTMTTVGLTPSYRFRSGNTSGRIGVRFDINRGGLEQNTRVAPDIDLQWSPSSRFAVFLGATGGEVMNTNAELWQRNPWMTGVLTMERSHVNADIRLGFTVGSYKGFWATVEGSWATVGNWAAPIVVEGVNTWHNMDGFSGFNFGLELGYSWRDIVTVVGHAAGATHGKYYKWQDNAKWAFDIAATVRPIERLKIRLGYDVRVDRFGFVFIPQPTVSRLAVFANEKTHLGDTSNLFLGADYELTDTLSLFLSAENLLNRHWALTSHIRSQGIHGLLGVQLKF